MKPFSATDRPHGTMTNLVSNAAPSGKPSEEDDVPKRSITMLDCPSRSDARVLTGGLPHWTLAEARIFGYAHPGQELENIPPPRIPGVEELIGYISRQARAVLTKYESVLIYAAAAQPIDTALQLLLARPDLHLHPFDSVTKRGWLPAQCPFQAALEHKRWDNLLVLVRALACPDETRKKLTQSRDLASWVKRIIEHKRIHCGKRQGSPADLTATTGTFAANERISTRPYWILAEAKIFGYASPAEELLLGSPPIIPGEEELIRYIKEQPSVVLMRYESELLHAAAAQPGIAALQLLCARQDLQLRPFDPVTKRGWLAAHCPFQAAIQHNRQDNLLALQQTIACPDATRESLMNSPDVPDWAKLILGRTPAN